MDKAEAVFTTKKIVVGLEPITHIIHDLDGEWQFLSNNDVFLEDLLIITLGQLLEIDLGIEPMLKIEMGYEAFKVNESDWNILKMSENE